MNLSDREILELSDLCNAVAEERITPSQNARLNEWLASSEEARGVYVRTMGLSASLYTYASEMQTESVEQGARSRSTRVKTAWWTIPMAIAAAVMLLIWVVKPTSFKRLANELKAEDSVAQLTGSSECQWTGAAVHPGDPLRKGSKLDLMRGFAEITFDSGAQVILEGPASLELNSAWDATLIKGTLKANVPPEAIGFRIFNPAVEVVDLGTIFTMIADGSGATDVLVLKGSVEAEPQNAADKQTILLREMESRRFANTGVSKVSDSERKFARYTQALPLDRFTPNTGYVHWSFDENDGRHFKADVSGSPASDFDAELESVSDASLPTAHTAGPRQLALFFNGRLYARAALPGISGDSPHTIAFWVQVKENTLLSDAYAMVAWRAATKKLGNRPVHISWNRNPTEGTVGVLRTDYAGGFALGATPLRDGRWHHIAVVLVPGDEPGTPVQVKQYVDGRFEGEGTPSPPGSSTPALELSALEAANVNDAVFLGCRLGNNGPRKERFRGAMDELFIADRAIGPVEIVSLMKDNQPFRRELAAAKE